jgi:putative DNA primase/helicase
VLDALVGASVEIGLEGLNDKWGLEDAYETGATVAFINDARFNPRDSSLAMNRLLSIIGNDPGIRVPRKNKREVTGRLPVRFHGTSNELPNLSDHTGALADRILVLQTTRGGIRHSAEEVHDLGKRIAATELGQVLRWAVEGLALLNVAEGRFARPGNADALADELGLALSNIAQFADECAEMGTAEYHLHRINCGCDQVDLDRLFYVFGKWASKNKSGERMSKAAFKRALTTTQLTTVNGGTVKPGQLASTKPGEKAPRVVWGIKSAEVQYLDRDRFGKRPFTGSLRLTPTQPTR